MKDAGDETMKTIRRFYTSIINILGSAEKLERIGEERGKERRDECL